MSAIGPADMSSVNAIRENTKALKAFNARQTGMSFSKENGLQLDAAEIGAEAAAEYDKKIASREVELASAIEVSNSLTALSSAVDNLGFAMKSLSGSSATILTTATPDSNLKNALTATASHGASPATHDITVKQVAAPQVWVIEGLHCISNNAKGTLQPFTDPTVPVVFAGDIPGMWGVPTGFYLPGGSNGKFKITNLGTTAEIILVAGDSLNSIAAKINSNEDAKAMGITASVVKTGTNAYQLIIKSKNTGSSSSFQVAPDDGNRAQNLFRNVYSHAATNSAVSVDIYSDANKTPWIGGNAAAGATGYNISKQIIINDVFIQLIPPLVGGTIAENLAAIVTTINTFKLDTGVIAKLRWDGNGAHEAYITLTRVDGLAGIDVKIPVDDIGAGFVSPSQLSFTGAGQDVVLDIDGIKYTSTTNTFAPVTPEGDLSSITVKAKGSGQLAIGQSSGLKTQIEAWIDSTNRALQFIAQNSQVDPITKEPTSKLFGTRALTDLNDLIVESGSAISSNPGETVVDSLAKIGITFTDYAGDASKGEVPTKYLTKDPDIFDGIMSDPAMISKVQALFKHYLSAESVALEGGTRGFINYLPENVLTNIDALRPISAYTNVGNTYAGNFDTIFIICTGFGVYNVQLQLGGVTVFDTNQHTITAVENVGPPADIRIQDQGGNGLDITVRTAGARMAPGNNLLIGNIQYIAPNVVIRPDNNAKLSLYNVDGRFNLTDFEVDFSRDMAGAYHATATKDGVTSNLTVASIGLNTFSLTGQDNTPFAGIQMSYSSTGLLNGQSNNFPHVTFKQSTFALKSEALNNYNNPKSGILYNAVQNADRELSRVSKDIMDIQTQQTNASDIAKARAIAIQMELQALDDAQEAIIDMIMGRSAASAA